MNTQLDKKNNAINVITLLVKKLEINISVSSIQEYLVVHPSYPSLNSFSDALSEFGVENSSYKLESIDELKELPPIFIAHLTDDNGRYVLVEHIGENSVIYYEKDKSKVVSTYSDFLSRWSGVVLAIHGKFRKRGVLPNLLDRNIWKALLKIVSILCLIVYTYITYSNIHNFKGVGSLYFLTKITGFIVSLLIFIESVGFKTAIAENLCSVNSSNSCKSVLSSDKSKILGLVSLSDIGLVYFTIGILSLNFINEHRSILTLIQLASLTSIIFVIYSLYTQLFVLKQTCVLCNIILLILVTEFYLAAISFDVVGPNFVSALYIFLLITLPTTALIYLKPYVLKYKSIKFNMAELNKFKSDSTVFNLLLKEGDIMPSISGNITPIQLGNLKAKSVITIVTNPFCKPCENLYKDVLSLLNYNNNIRVDIIIACNSSDSKSANVVRMFLGQAERDSFETILTNWYNSTNKNHILNNWSYISQNNSNVDDTISRFLKWCSDAKIIETPTIFVNGYRLPKLYSISNLKWLL